MILCVFEGKRETVWFDIIHSLYIKDEIVKYFVVSSTFHSLYKKLKENEWDLVPALKMMERERGLNLLQEYSASSFSEIYLFFDYDPHDSHNDIDILNNELKDMLDYFNEETENGKMFVNYPMLEALLYTKKLPDVQYYTYEFLISRCSAFKQEAASFSFYKSHNFITDSKPERVDHVRNNWNALILQNAAKANYICTGAHVLPEKKEYISQINIFNSQNERYTNKVEPSISVLSGLALFLYDYLKPLGTLQ